MYEIQNAILQSFWSNCMIQKKIPAKLSSISIIKRKQTKASEQKGTYTAVAEL